MTHQSRNIRTIVLCAATLCAVNGDYQQPAAQELMSSEDGATIELQQPGHFRAPPLTLDTETLQMTGHRPEPVTLDTETLQMTGHRPEPVTLGTGALTVTGYGRDPITLQTDAMQLTGYHRKAVTLTTSTLRLTGWSEAARRIGRLEPPSDLGITASGPDSCQAGSVCRFDNTVSNLGNTPFDGPLSVRIEVNISGARISPIARDWSCADDDCVRPAASLAPGETTPFAINLSLPASAAGQGKLRQCATLAPLSPNDAPVRFVQIMLNAAGVDVGPADNQIGPRTRAGIIEFRRGAGLSGGGEIDEGLLATLGRRVPSDNNPRNDRACSEVTIAPAATCRFGFKAAGGTCEPICPQRNTYFNGTRCVVCPAGFSWDASSRRCAGVSPSQPMPKQPIPDQRAPGPEARPAPRILVPPLLRQPQQRIVVTCTGGQVRGQQCVCPPRWSRQTVRIAPTARIFNCKPPNR